MSCCGILCNCNDIVQCSGCEFYEYAFLYLMLNLYEDIENIKGK